MHPFHIPSACFFLLLGFKITCAVPLQSAALTNEDMDVLKLLLHRLEESIPTKLQDQTWPQDDTLVPDLEKTALTEAQDRAQPQLNAKDYLSARDLRTVRHDSSAKRYSGCFSRRLDRIGSMSSLGCNTIGRHNSKRN